MSSLEIYRIAAYLLPLAAVLFFYARIRRRQESAASKVLKEMVEAGLTEPSSLHPVIDLSKCLGAGACITACPEEALGIIKGKAHFIEPAACLGHGACQIACPHDAITLVFGTEKRGMDIPQVDPNFETNVPGIFIAGELGGMGMIRKAALQGSEAMKTICTRKGAANQLDLVIVGAGPAGLTSGLVAIEKKMRYVILEQESSLGGCIYQYPRGKICMTAPFKFPLVGEVKWNEISKEQLFEFWNGVLEKTGMQINLGERMETITRTDNGFIVKTTKQSYDTKTILLAIGRRGTPRKLGVPGEELSKVVYRLIDAEQYKNMHVLVVGGGDSALEAAIAIAEQPGTTVALSYRSDAFGRGKQKNRDRLLELEKEGKIRVLLKSNVKLIEPDKVTLDHNGQIIELENEAIIVSAGGILPTPFLKEIGVMVEAKFGTT